MDQQEAQQQAMPENTENATGQSGQPAEQNSGETQGRTYTQAEVEATIKERLERERKKQERDTAKQKEQAEAQALEARAEWEQLAGKRQITINTYESTIAELEPMRDRVGALEGVLGEYVKAEREALPQHILDLLDEMPVEKQLAWIAKNREVITEPTTAARRTAADATRNTTGGDFEGSRLAFNDMLRQKIH